MSKDLQDVNHRIIDCKKGIEKFTNYKNRWWDLFNYFTFTKEQCNYYISSYENMLRLNVLTKRRIINKHE